VTRACSIKTKNHDGNFIGLQPSTRNLCLKLFLFSLRYFGRLSEKVQKFSVIFRFLGPRNPPSRARGSPGQMVDSPPHEFMLPRCKKNKSCYESQSTKLLFASGQPSRPRTPYPAHASPRFRCSGYKAYTHTVSRNTKHNFTPPKGLKSTNEPTTILVTSVKIKLRTTGRGERQRWFDQ